MRKTVGRDLPGGGYVEITAELRGEATSSGVLEGGTLSPGFSVTLLGWDGSGTWTGRACKRNGRDATHAGADHETILMVAPELAPIVAVHLAAPDGTPMHAEANGWYFYSGGSARSPQHDKARRALHLPEQVTIPAGMTRKDFGAYVESLREYWRLMAEDARDALHRMIDGDGVEQ